MLGDILTGCYLPGAFKAEIRIDTETGAYEVSYNGELIDSGLLQKLADGALDAEDESEKVAAAARELGRDSAFSSIEYQGGGVFAVRYARKGNIHRHRHTTFVSQNSRIVSISYIKDDAIIKVLGGAVPKSYHKQLLAIGYSVRGELRVSTSGAVNDHNASQVLPGPETTYIWLFHNIDDPPARLIIG